ncbi:MAG: hypothetical protein DCC49_03680 [Acidobacteria bacterium]|nr:MAG: hypothetical protein DCC49_03680 [Acidobacteriota bacterium]
MALRILSAAAGAIIVALTLRSAIRTLVLPRAVPVVLTRIAAVIVRYLFLWRAKASRTFADKDRALAALGPTIVLGLAVVWIILILAGYSLIYWSIEMGTASSAVRQSGSSLFTLGYAAPNNRISTLLSFSQAGIGMGIVALLIAYLPILYSTFSERERAVATIAVRAGSPPRGVEMLARFYVIGHWDELRTTFQEWEELFAGLEESHTTFAVLPLFRSPDPNRSWITAAGAVLDAASLRSSVVEGERDAAAEICIRAGFTSLRRIASVFGIPYDPDPDPRDPISITREEFDDACDELEEAGVALKSDRDQAWRDFAGWRVNYDVVLIALAGLLVAPWAPWSSDRAMPILPPAIRTKRSVRRMTEWAERPAKNPGPVHPPD